MSDELPMYGDLMVQYEECQSQVAHLRQENAELKAEVLQWKSDESHQRERGFQWRDEWEKCYSDLQRHKNALEKCREVLKQCLMASTSFLMDDWIRAAMDAIAVNETPQLTQDPNTHRIIKACLPYLRNDNTRQLYFEACKVLGIEPDVWGDEPQQDPASDIAYGLYPSSARPVNPNPGKSENWVGYTPIDPQSK